MAKSKRKGKHNPALKDLIAGAEEPFDVFLSHNSKNKPIVKELATELKRRGLKVWLDEWELVPGRPWQEAIEEIIQTTRTAAVLIGKDGMGPWEIPEMRACLSEFINRKLPVIPVLLPGAPDEIELPLFLRLFTWVDLRKGFTKDGFDRLEWGITGKRPKDEQEAKLLLQIHNLPYRSIGGIFKGRDKILARLKEHLGGDKPMAITQGIHGLGGIGKTRLAVEFGWWALENKKYDRVFFVNSETPEKLRDSLASLAGEEILGLPGQKEDEQYKSVCKWLMGNSRWLMILDNADTEAAACAVEDLLTSLANGSVIITSRYSHWSGSVKARQLDLLEPQQAKQFLLERTAGHRVESGSDEDTAEKLAKELGYLPLALEQSAAYIAKNKCSLAEYIEEWENKRQDVLKWYDERTMKYPVSVAVTWQRTFERLGPSARTLLRLAAFLAPEMIPSDMFREGTEIANKAAGLQCEEMKVKKVKFELKEALSELAAYSMITRQQKGFTVHRIVQQVLQSRIPESDRQSWLEIALKIVNNYAPSGSDDVGTWPVWDDLRPHAELIAQTADLAKITEPTDRLMSVLGTYLHYKGLYEKAEYWKSRALKIDEKSFGPDHPKVAVDLNNLAQLLADTNRLEQAEPLMRRALKIFEDSLGRDHPNTRTVRNNLKRL
ncbi:MAG TPA: TIR domain-containing protein [Sedimentisphaerales bacterium]|nr:TIR domain-containing protein [Sedimentisphaerales bacterium]